MGFFDTYKIFLLAMACSYILSAITIGIGATFRPTDIINNKQYIVFDKSNTNKQVYINCTSKTIEPYNTSASPKSSKYTSQICESHQAHQWYLPNDEKGIESYVISLAIIIFSCIDLGWIRKLFGTDADQVPKEHYKYYIVWLLSSVIINSFFKLINSDFNHDVVFCTVVFFIFFSEFWNIVENKYSANETLKMLEDSVSRPLLVILNIFIVLCVLVAYAWALSATVQFHHTLANSWAGFGWSFLLVGITIPLFLAVQQYKKQTKPKESNQPAETRKPRFKEHTNIELKF